MKSFNRFAAAVFLAIAVIFIGTNICLNRAGTNTGGRMYRVEAARLAEKIRQNGSGSPDLSACQYVTNVACWKDTQQTGWINSRLGQFFEETDSDYCIRAVDGALYRFDYTAQAKTALDHSRAFVNLALAAMAALSVFVLLYIRQNIIEPFERLKEVPFELAQGRLAVSLPEKKSRFFGRFLWGVDLLREYMEKQKKQELELYRKQKTLVLSVSHDLKTPLSAVKLYAKVIARHMYADTQQLEKIAAAIDAKADEIGAYAAQMARSSGGEFLNLEVREDSFYLSQLVKKTAAYYEDKLPLLQTEFLVGNYADCMLRGDFDRSVEVLQNVMENAVKYGDGEKIALTFSEEENCVLVSVTNSGNTLPETELMHIFDSFWRGSNARSSTGSGLGLFICRSLMRRMGGDIFAKVHDDKMCVTAVFQMM